MIIDENENYDDGDYDNGDDGDENKNVDEDYDGLTASLLPLFVCQD